MLAQYNNNGHTARYVCQAMKSSYGAPFCQSLKARPLDDLIASLVLEAVTPAAIEASVALAENLEAERAVLDRHWLQRLSARDTRSNARAGSMRPWSRRTGWWRVRSNAPGRRL